MGATFSRIKNWTTEVLSNTDLNAEIDNILNNLGPAGVDDYSSSAAQMKLQTSPGSLGSESLATSMAGEIERLRFVIQRIVGTSTTYWYEAPSSSITDLVSSLGSGLPPNRIASGATRSGSSQMLALIPNGTAASITLSASTTPFVYYIGGTQYSLTANVTLSSLGTAAATNNTCLASDTDMVDQQFTKFWGQYGTVINVTAMGSSISALTGSIAGFKVGTAANTECFVAYVNSTTQLTQAWRGCFFNSSGSDRPAVSLTLGGVNETLSLMRLTWLFATTAGSIAVTYNNPKVSAVQPGGPATGDYWFDLTATAWKTYNSVTWVSANATLIGMSLQDTSACIAARTFDSYKATSDANTLELERVSNTVVQAKEMFGEASVFGTKLSFGVSRPSWDITSHLDTGQTEAVNRYYYLYLKENGSPAITDVAPMFRPDMSGLYYPTHTWRCIGSVYNDSSTHFSTPVRSFRQNVEPFLLMGDATAYVDATGATTQPQVAMFPDYFVETYSAGALNFTTAIGINTWGDVASVSLTQGVWKLTGYFTLSSASTPAVTNVYYGVGTSAGNNTPSRAALRLTFPSKATAGGTCLLYPYYVSVTAPGTIYYLKANADNTPSDLSINSHALQAERVDSLVGTL